MRKIKFPFASKETNVPVVRFFLPNGKEAYGIVDSGSESTLLSKKLVRDNKDCFEELPVENMMDVIGIAGKDSTVVVEQKAMIRFNKRHKTTFEIVGMLFDFTVISSHFHDIEISALFGSDFLEKNNVIIDYENCCVMI